MKAVWYIQASIQIDEGDSLENEEKVCVSAVKPWCDRGGVSLQVYIGIESLVITDRRTGFAKTGLTIRNGALVVRPGCGRMQVSTQEGMEGE